MISAFFSSSLLKGHDIVKSFIDRLTSFLCHSVIPWFISTSLVYCLSNIFIIQSVIDIFTNKLMMHFRTHYIFLEIFTNKLMMHFRSHYIFLDICIHQKVGWISDTLHLSLTYSPIGYMHLGTFHLSLTYSPISWMNLGHITSFLDKFINRLDAFRNIFPW